MHIAHFQYILNGDYSYGEETDEIGVYHGETANIEEKGQYMKLRVYRKVIIRHNANHYNINMNQTRHKEHIWDETLDQNDS